MSLRRFAVRVHDPEHPLFEEDWVHIQGAEAQRVVADLFPTGPSGSIVGGLYGGLLRVRTTTVALLRGAARAFGQPDSRVGGPL